MSAEEASRIARAVQRMRNAKRGLQIALPTAAALGAGAAVAVGSIPGGDGTITACYAGTNGATLPINTFLTATEAPGALRAIDPSLPNTISTPAGGPTPNLAAVCDPKQETQITWNQKGPAGPQGAQGPTGPQGASGESGGGETGFGIGNPAGNTFLKLDGINGGVTDKQHKGEIEISSFSFGISNTSSHGAGGGGGAGKTSFQSFKITKSVDKSSPLLALAAATGKHIKQAELIFARKAGKHEDFLEIKMNDVLISSYQTGGSSKGVPQEQLSFAFLKMQETFINGDGKPGPTVNVNVSANAKI
ncbi:MAG TPA: type VI secretion system tube protein Hcp [Solirubrobacteraceae bacterium]|jgi:type VI secretion system secreted protein Hcp|nr:type VI secretion system tube protein Hcp [Solirubrobacteraceae bacterium]